MSQPKTWKVATIISGLIVLAFIAMIVTIIVAGRNQRFKERSEPFVTMVKNADLASLQKLCVKGKPMPTQNIDGYAAICSATALETTSQVYSVTIYLYLTPEEAKNGRESDRIGHVVVNGEKNPHRITSVIFQWEGATAPID